MRDTLAELATPPILVFPNWDAVADGSRPFHVYYDACIDGFGAALKQEQEDGSIKPIAYINRATLDSERNWIPLDLEAGSIVWALKRLRGYLWGTKFCIFLDQNALESTGKAGNHNARVQRWLEFLTEFDTHSSTAKQVRTATLTSSLDYQNLPRSMTTTGRRVSTLLRIAVYIS